jgi:monomeric isocitrate dehydrogenase
VALYWAEELAARDKAWEPLAKALKDNEETIVKELIECQVKSFTFSEINILYFFHLFRLVSLPVYSFYFRHCLPW